jgi:hypothetical protein
MADLAGWLVDWADRVSRTQTGRLSCSFGRARRIITSIDDACMHEKEGQLILAAVLQACREGGPWSVGLSGGRQKALAKEKTKGGEVQREAGPRTQTSWRRSRSAPPATCFRRSKGY